MKFRDLIEAKDVWKTGGQQVFTYKGKSVLYTVKNKKITFKIKVDGKSVETEIGLDKNPEKDIRDFLDKELNEAAEETK